MMLSTGTAHRFAPSGSSMAGVTPRVGSSSSRAQVVAPPKAVTAWEAWSPYMIKRGAAEGAASLKETGISKEVGACISKCAQGFKPKFTAHHENTTTTDFKLSHIGSINVDNLPKDLHERLEAVANLQLKQAMRMDDKAELDSATIAFTTTELDAAICVTGCTLQKGLDKTALVSIVATETEREASWSRLEGLLLHWACSEDSSSGWNLPPTGWSSSTKATDAGGAWQNGFEKTMDGSRAMYTLLLQLPLRGVLRSGGIVFVLKATAGQNTRWLKDERTQKDFFVDLSPLPVLKA